MSFKINLDFNYRATKLDKLYTDANKSEKLVPSSNNYDAVSNNNGVQEVNKYGGVSSGESETMDFSTDISSKNDVSVNLDTKDVSSQSVTNNASIESTEKMNVTDSPGNQITDESTTSSPNVENSEVLSKNNVNVSGETSTQGTNQSFDSDTSKTNSSFSINKDNSVNDGNVDSKMAGNESIKNNNTSMSNPNMKSTSGNMNGGQSNVNINANNQSVSKDNKTDMDNNSVKVDADFKNGVSNSDVSSGSKVISSNIEAAMNSYNADSINIDYVEELKSFGLNDTDINRIINGLITPEALFEEIQNDPDNVRKKALMEASYLHEFGLNVNNLDDLMDMISNSKIELEKLKSDKIRAYEEEYKLDVVRDILTRLQNDEDLDSILDDSLTVWKITDLEGNSYYKYNDGTNFDNDPNMSLDASFEMSNLTYQEMLEGSGYLEQIKSLLTMVEEGNIFSKKELLIWDDTDSQRQFLSEFNNLLEKNQNKLSEINEKIATDKENIYNYNIIYNTIEHEIDYYLDNIDPYIMKSDFDFNNKFNDECLATVDRIYEEYSNIYTKAVVKNSSSQTNYQINVSDKKEVVDIIACIINGEKKVSGGHMFINDAIVKLNSPDDMIYHYGIWYDQMHQTEKDIFNYIYNIYGADKAYEYLEKIADELDSRWLASQREKDSEYAKEHKVLGSVGSIIITPFEGISAACYSMNAILCHNNIRRTDVYSMGDEWRSAIAMDIGDKYGGLLSFLYSTGMSMADSIALIGLGAATGGAGMPVISAVTMGSRAYVSSLNEALDRGLSDGAAVAIAWSSAVAETMMESYSAGHLLNLEGKLGSVTGDLVKKIGNSISNPKLAKIATVSFIIMANSLSQGLAEGEEEFATEILNFICDNIISGDLSQHSKAIQNYIDQGMTEDQARNLANQEFYSQLFQAYLGGFVSGCGFGSFSGIRTTHSVSKSLSNNIIQDYQGEGKLSRVDALRQIDAQAFANAIAERYELAEQYEKYEKDNKKAKRKMFVDKFLKIIHGNSVNTSNNTQLGAEVNDNIEMENEISTASEINIDTGVTDTTKLPLSPFFLEYDTKIKELIVKASRTEKNNRASIFDIVDDIDSYFYRMLARTPLEAINEIITQKEKVILQEITNCNLSELDKMKEKYLYGLSSESQNLVTANIRNDNYSDWNFELALSKCNSLNELLHAIHQIALTYMDVEINNGTDLTQGNGVINSVPDINYEYKYDSNKIIAESIIEKVNTFDIEDFFLSNTENVTEHSGLLVVTDKQFVISETLNDGVMPHGAMEMNIYKAIYDVDPTSYENLNNMMQMINIKRYGRNNIVARLLNEGNSDRNFSIVFPKQISSMQYQQLVEFNHKFGEKLKNISEKLGEPIIFFHDSLTGDNIRTSDFAEVLGYAKKIISEDSHTYEEEHILAKGTENTPGSDISYDNDRISDTVVFDKIFSFFNMNNSSSTDIKLSNQIREHVDANTQRKQVEYINQQISEKGEFTFSVRSTIDLTSNMLRNISDLSKLRVQILSGFVDLNGNFKEKYNSTKYVDRMTYTGYEALNIVFKIEQLESMINLNLPTRQRARQIYELIASTYSYIYDFGSNHKVVASLRGITEYNAIGREGLVCAGYASLFKELCTRTGILCDYITGYSGEKHAWNVVIDGNKIIPVDVTWKATSDRDWFGVSELFQDRHRAEQDEMFTNYSDEYAYSDSIRSLNINSSQLSFEQMSYDNLSYNEIIEEVISIMDVKYGYGSGLKNLKLFVETGNINYITTTNDARNIISKLSVDYIREYINARIVESPLSKVVGVLSNKYGTDYVVEILRKYVDTGNLNVITRDGNARKIIEFVSTEEIQQFIDAKVSLDHIAKIMRYKYGDNGYEMFIDYLQTGELKRITRDFDARSIASTISEVDRQIYLSIQQFDLEMSFFGQNNKTPKLMGTLINGMKSQRSFGLAPPTESDLDGNYSNNSFINSNTNKNSNTVIKHLIDISKITDSNELLNELYKNNNLISNMARDKRSITDFLEFKKIGTNTSFMYTNSVAMNNFKNLIVKKTFDDGGSGITISGISKEYSAEELWEKQRANYDYRITIRNSDQITVDEAVAFINKLVEEANLRGLNLRAKNHWEADAFIIYLEQSDLYGTVQLLEDLRYNTEYGSLVNDATRHFGNTQPFSATLYDDSYYGISMAHSELKYGDKPHLLSSHGFYGDTFNGYMDEVLGKVYESLLSKHNGNIDEITVDEMYDAVVKYHKNYALGNPDSDYDIPLWMNRRIFQDFIRMNDN